MKVYLLNLNEIGSHSKDDIQVDFESNSLDLKIRNYNGKNYRLRLDPLHKDIDVAECKMQIKSNSITISLKKHDTLKHWTDIVAKTKEPKAS